MDCQHRTLFFFFFIFTTCFSSTNSQCTFPSALRGNWTSSREGPLTFNSTTMSGYLSCKAGNSAASCNVLPTDWTCVETSDNKYLLRSPEVTSIYLYICLYLERISSTKFVYYQGPNELLPTLNDYVVAVGTSTNPSLDSICNLPTPTPVDRYHVLVNTDYILTSASFCPTELLGTFRHDDSSPCNHHFTFDSCTDKQTVQVSNTSCSPPILRSENGTLSCLYSLSDVSTSTTYVTLYNRDNTVDDINTFSFICAALFADDGQLLVTLQSYDCIDLLSPNVTTPEYTLNATLYCPITCQFESTLQGTWISSRKGQIDVSGDTMAGFEPYGVDCMTSTCLKTPTTFECYMTVDDKYLIRSGPLTLNSMAVRIYVCLDFTSVNGTKLLYYHDHQSQHEDLQDYVVTLNAASPVDSITEVCEYTPSFDPALYTVLVRPDNISSNVINCPSQFSGIYNTTISNCDFTLSSCENQQQLKLSNTSCGSSSPFYSEGGVLSCLHSTTSGNLTFLTLYNEDSNTSLPGVYQFSCVALEQVGSNLLFSQTPYGCHEGQTSTHVNKTDGATFTFVSIGDCPVEEPSDDSDFPWYIIVVAILALIIVIILIIIIIWCCCRKSTRTRRKTDQENVVSEPDDEGGKKRKRRVKKSGQCGEPDGGEEECNEHKPPIKQLRDVFTVGPAKEVFIRDKNGNMIRRVEEEDDDDAESWGSDLSGDDVEKNKIKRRRKRRRHGKPRNVTGSSLEETTEEDTSSSSSCEDDDAEDDEFDDNMSQYSQSCRYSDEEFEDDDGSHLTIDDEKPRRDLFGSHYNLHVAKAWEKRKLDPNWLKSESMPKSRSDLEPVQTDSYSKGLPQGVHVPIADVFRRSTAYRKGRKDGRSLSSRTSSSPRHGSFSPVRRQPSINHRLADARMGFTREIPYMDLYLNYTEKRLQMMDEGFWDDESANKLAEEYFGFVELDAKLSRLEEIEGELQALERTDGNPTRSPTMSRMSDATSLQVTQSVAQPVPTDDNDTGIDSKSHSNVSVHMEAYPSRRESKDVHRKSSTREHSDREPGLEESTSETERKLSSKTERVTFKGTSQMMARLYARLSELRTTKPEDDVATTESSDTTTKQRRRIRTALRRLLNERLFPDQCQNRKAKQNDNGADPESLAKDDAMLSGTVTPATMVSRSKTAISIRSRTGLETRDGQKGHVVFVGENSQITESETDGSHGENNRENRSQSARDERGDKDAPGYYRRHLGPVRNPNNISRLYQPARSPTNLSKTTLEGIQKDQAFLDKLKEDRRALEEMSPQNGHLSPNDESSTSSRDSRSGSRPNLNWAYNFQKGRHNFHNSPDKQSASERKLRDLEDWQLRNLLQELYKDKQYMDKVISTPNDNDVEEQVAVSLEQSREYLLQRAMYWLERGPPPPRPPTTELGLRLEREQTMLSSRSTNSPAKGSNQESEKGGRAVSSHSNVPWNKRNSNTVEPKPNTERKSDADPKGRDQR